MNSCPSGGNTCSPARALRGDPFEGRVESGRNRAHRPNSRHARGRASTAASLQIQHAAGEDDPDVLRRQAMVEDDLLLCAVGLCELSPDRFARPELPAQAVEDQRIVLPDRIVVGRIRKDQRNDARNSRGSRCESVQSPARRRPSRRDTSGRSPHVRGSTPARSCRGRTIIPAFPESRTAEARSAKVGLPASLKHSKTTFA